jgi:hypothetical protein
MPLRRSNHENRSLATVATTAGQGNKTDMKTKDDKTTKPTHTGGDYKGNDEEKAQAEFAQMLIDAVNAKKKEGKK